MTIAIDTLTIHRDKLFEYIEGRIRTRNILIKNIATLEEEMDKYLEDLVLINRAIDLLEDNQ